MKKQVILCLKVAWAVAAVIILLVGTNLCTSTDEACLAAGNTMSFFMVILTFPTGIIFFPIAMALADSVGGHYPSDFIVGWSVLAIGGFVQWYYFVPLLLEKPRLTLLNLNAESAPPAAPTPDPLNAQPMTATANIVSPARTRIRVRKQQNQVRSYDKLGRSPLERVLNR
ncbi:MAG TPA: hypothetical protein VHP99_03970 [Pyrinomonadaceae bacterium]|jgi:hypothetical protein|nr:hypothetical protein [Pyrinomonadaceae bacterium]